MTRKPISAISAMAMHGNTRNAIARRWKAGYKMHAISAEFQRPASEIVDSLLAAGCLKIECVEIMLENRK